MQLIEYIIWSFIDNKKVRFITSLFAALLLILQPIAAISVLYPKQIMYQLLYTYIILIGLIHIYIWMNYNKPINELYDMYPGEKGHLIWKWLQKNHYTLLYLIVYFIFLINPKREIKYKTNYLEYNSTINCSLMFSGTLSLSG